MSYEGRGGVLALQGAGRWACAEHGGTHEDSRCWRERRDSRAFREACLFLLALSVGLTLSRPLLCAFLLQLLFSSTHTLLPCSPAGNCAHDQEPRGRKDRLVLSVCEHRSFSAFIPVSLVWGCGGGEGELCSWDTLWAAYR